MTVENLHTEDEIMIAEFQSAHAQLRALNMKYGSKDVSHDIQCAMDHVGDAMLSLVPSLRE